MKAEPRIAAAGLVRSSTFGLGSPGPRRHTHREDAAARSVIGNGNARSQAMLIAAIAAVAAMQLHLVFVQGFNWDEFFYLSKVYLLHEGALTSGLQSIHTRLFAWLPSVPGNEIAELRVARMAMLACELVTVGCIVAIASRFTDRIAALLAGLTYVSGGYVFQHGFSFRADPLAAMLLMSALCLMLRARWHWPTICAIALLLALAALVTVKSAFYAPAFAGIAWVRLRESNRPGRDAARLVGTGALAVLLFGAIYLLHKTGVVPADSAAPQAMLANAAEKMFSASLAPQFDVLLDQMIRAPFLAVTVIAAFALVFLTDRPFEEKVALTGMLLPVLTVLIYRNSFPYYYAFILPPAVAASAIVFRSLALRYALAPLAALPLLSGILLYWATPKHMQAVQNDVFRAVHQVFPTPVPYIDFSSMISSFPKVGFFMSGWGMENYRDANRPVFDEILARSGAPLLLVNHAAFEAAVNGGVPSVPLLPQDAAVLRDNFIHHWGPLWVAGKAVPPGDSVTVTAIAIAGPYTVEGAPLVIDGSNHPVGSVVHLERGKHRIGGGRPDQAHLRWGRNLPKPDLAEPPRGRYAIFTPF